MKYGPSVEIKCSLKEMEELFSNHNLKLTYLNEDIGQNLDEANHIIIYMKRRNYQ